MGFEKAQIKSLLKNQDIKSLNDLNSFLKQISKEVLEILSEQEMTDFLWYDKYDYSKKQISNSRNGFSKKKVNTSFGEIEYNKPRDRNSEYDSILVNKYQKDISGIEDKIISMYAKGMSTRDIQEHIKSIYDYEISPESVNNAGVFNSFLIPNCYKISTFLNRSPSAYEVGLSRRQDFQ